MYLQLCLKQELQIYLPAAVNGNHKISGNAVSRYNCQMALESDQKESRKLLVTDEAVNKGKDMNPHILQKQAKGCVVLVCQNDYKFNFIKV